MSDISAPGSSALSFVGDFTVEFWALQLSGGGQFQRLFALYPDGATSYGAVQLAISLEPSAILWAGGGVAFSGIEASGSWQHWAIVRASGTVTLYVAGVLQASLVSASTIGGVGTTLYIGGRDVSIGEASNSQFNGLISNFRIIDGTALYTGPFQPPSSPLAAVVGTVLLLSTESPSTVLSDSSSNAVVLSTGGSPTWDMRTPFCIGERLLGDA